MLVASATSHGMDDFTVDALGQRPHALFQGLALKVKASWAPSWQALEIAQAIERSLATPMIRPFFPAMSCAAEVMTSFLAG